MTVVDRITTTVQMPKKLDFLFDAHRYKVIYGGRGGAKSWSIARALLVLGAAGRERILCAREIQKSIKDSVHKLLSDQIVALGLEDFYDILEHEIRGRNGTEFIFSGLADHTVSSIKSFENISISWIEEAQTVSKRSWDILIPTIRKEGSEIWVSFNPELDTDETYVRFVTAPPPGAKVEAITYRDNPWFPQTLEQERVHSQRTQPDDYDNIWEGKPRAAVAGAIFAREVQAMVTERRICHLPYDPRMKVHTVWDMGWNDQMSVGLFQRGLSEVRCIRYLEKSFTRTDEFAAELNALRLNWGYDFLPWDGFSQQRQTGKSDADVLTAFGRRPKQVPNVEDAEQTRIRAARQLFPRMYADQTHCARLIECWKRYRRHVPKHGEPAAPIHDQFSHGCDMTGYMALIVEQMTNEDSPKPRIRQFEPSDAVMGVLG